MVGYFGEEDLSTAMMLRSIRVVIFREKFDIFVRIRMVIKRVEAAWTVWQVVEVEIDEVV